MRWIDDYRQQDDVSTLLEAIKQAMHQLPVYSAQHPLQIMEVCGGHTHAIFRFGLDKLLPESIDFIHGPGCPVCVLPTRRIDECIEIAQHKEVIFLSYGDALRVPGSHGSLLDARRRGADVRMIYSPLDALAIAQENPQRKVVLFALGFETTMPASAVTFIKAQAMGLTNLFGFCQHITIMPTLEQLLSDPQQKIAGLLGPGHVSMIIGAQAYHRLCERFKTPLVISGFEPVDMLQSVLMIIQQLIAGQGYVENQYARVVRDDGNRQAQQAIEKVFTLKATSEWRGLGDIPYSGMQFAPEFAAFDAERLFALTTHQSCEHAKACCNEVLTGRLKPQACPLFANECSPAQPIGALMVSSEGACAACYKYAPEDLCQTM